MTFVNRMFGKEQKTPEQLKEEDERLDIELSVAQKKAVLAKLRANNLSVSDMGGWKRAWHWFKTH